MGLHWGTITDVGFLSEALKIGFIIFGSTMLGAGRWIHGLNLEGADFPYRLSLYNIDVVYFQFLVMTGQECSENGLSVLCAEDVPPPVAQHFQLCNNMCIGHRGGSGVN